MPVVTASSGHLVSEDTKCYRIAGRTPKRNAAGSIPVWDVR
jgi:hypothetical protein